jgi:hypothetical protein
VEAGSAAQAARAERRAAAVPLEPADLRALAAALVLVVVWAERAAVERVVSPVCLEAAVEPVRKGNLARAERQAQPVHQVFPARAEPMGIRAAAAPAVRAVRLVQAAPLARREDSDSLERLDQLAQVV